MFSAAGSANGSDVILKRQSVHTPIDIKEVFWNQKNDSATRIAIIAGKKKKIIDSRDPENKRANQERKTYTDGVSKTEESTCCGCLVLRTKSLPRRRQRQHRTRQVLYRTTV